MRLLAACAAAVLLAPFAVSAQSLWQDVNEQAMVRGLSPQRAVAAKRDIVPQLYRTVNLDLEGMRERLAAAPKEFSAQIEAANTEIVLPLPYGGFGRFMVQDSPIMELGLADKYPQLKTYVAQGIDDPSATARIDLTVRGFRAVVLSARGQFYIDPYWTDDVKTYISYFKRNFGQKDKGFRCLVQSEVDLSKLQEGLPPRLNRPTGATLRIYRAAVAATGEYTAAVSGTNPGTVVQALSAMVTTMNRVSAIYERDLAIRLILVANTDLLIYTNALTDPYTDSDGGTNAPSTLLSQNRTNVNSIIGNANYDIGHVFSTNGGGIASLGVVCSGTTGTKAGGVTGITLPTGDPFDVDYVAHEMGHQFGANHPFNGNVSNCAGGNRNAATAYEPGSGTSIMAYAGICPPQDLADHSDDYFHAISYQEIDTRAAAGGNCFVGTPTGNSPPVIAAMTNRIIPSQTPFTLTASATDVDGDTLTYCWEEFDLGATQDPTAAPRDNGASPLFRSFDPSPSPSRIFPSLTYILNNANVPPPTIATTPIVIASGEFLPTTNRTMNFRVTVRDNHLAGGGSDYGVVTVQSIAAAGPFAITSHNTASILAAGDSVNVTWNVAGSDANGINCANVAITLSTDGGLTFPITLAASTPNNGSATVVIPSVAQVATTQGRIKVEALGNIFFDLNNADLTITTPNSAPTVFVAGDITISRGAAAPVLAAVAIIGDANANSMSASVSGVPADVTVVPSIASGGVVMLSAQANCTIVTSYTTRVYPIKLTVTDSIGSSTSATVNLVITPNPVPTLGQYANAFTPRGLVTNIAPPTGPADANGNLLPSPFTVAPATLPGGGTIAINQSTGVVTVAATAGSTLGATTVRVTLADACGATFIRQFVVTVTGVAPVLAASASTAILSESCGAGNGVIDPTELVSVRLPVVNNGGSATTNLVGTLQASGGVTPSGAGTFNYGAVAAGSSANGAFSFTAAGTCGGTVTATVALQDGATSYGNVTYVFTLGVKREVAIFSESFEAATVPALPSGWTSVVLPVGSAATAFRTVSSATASDTPPNYAIVNPLASGANVTLVSALVTIPSIGSNRIDFKHRWVAKLNSCGGLFEISYDGVNFTDILTAGGTNLSGPYNGTIAAGSNVLNGRQAWTGAGNGSYTATSFQLPPAASGQTATFRWKIANDNTALLAGSSWRIDTVRVVTTTYGCSTCTGAPEFSSVSPANQLTVGTPYAHLFTAVASPAATFSVVSGTLPPGVTLTPSGMLTGTPSSAGVGLFPVTVRATNGTMPDSDQTFVLSVRTLAANYLAGYGLVGGNAALTADPNGDGVSNLMAYALGLDPNTSTANLLPVAGIKSYGGVPYFYITFNRSSVATDLTYRVQVSADLQTWSTISTSTAGAATSGSGFVGETGPAPTFNVEVRDIQRVDPITGAHRFLRLQVTTP